MLFGNAVRKNSISLQKGRQIFSLVKIADAATEAQNVPRGTFENTRHYFRTVIANVTDRKEFGCISSRFDAIHRVWEAITT